MDQLKEICKIYSKWEPLNAFVIRIEAYPDNGPLISDNCKCLIEAICKTILEDLGIPKEEHKKYIHELAKQTVENLKCINKSNTIVSAFINAINSLAEFRNEYTETGHGQSVYTILKNQGAVTGATISYITAITEQTAIFLITVYQDEYPAQIQNKLHYEDNPDFNETFDETTEPIQIGSYGPYSPSEVLFYIDNNAYKSELNNQ